MISPGSKTCASCGSLRGVDERFCGNCGKPLEAAGGGSPTVPSGGLRQTPITPILERTQPVSPPEPTLPISTLSPPRQSPSPAKLLVVIGVLVLILAGAGFFELGRFVTSNQQGSPGNTPGTSNQSGAISANSNATATNAPPTTVPTATSIPTPSPTPATQLTPTSTLLSKPDVLYQADWSSGMNGWVGSSEWKVVHGVLVSDGTHAGLTAYGDDAVTSPYQPSTANYAAEAKIQIVSSPDHCYFALRGRVQPDGSEYDGYFVGFDTNYGDALIAAFSARDTWSPIKSQTYTPDLNWHTYQAAFKGNQITLKIDGSVVLQVTDNKFINPGQVGLANGDCQINVSSFQVIAL